MKDLKHIELECGECGCPCHETEWPDEGRIDIIGQNGNDGLHYEEVDGKS